LTDLIAQLDGGEADGQLMYASDHGQSLGEGELIFMVRQESATQAAVCQP